MACRQLHSELAGEKTNNTEPLALISCGRPAADARPATKNGVLRVSGSGVAVLSDHIRVLPVAAGSANHMQMLRVMHVALVLLVLTGATKPTTSAASAVQRSAVVVGYLPEWRYEAYDWDRAAQLHTHLILFSIEVASYHGAWQTGQPTLTGLDRMPAPALMRRARLATRKANCQLLLCVGGNGRSAGFARMVADARHRAAFVADLVALLSEHGLDGVDYNWEVLDVQTISHVAVAFSLTTTTTHTHTRTHARARTVSWLRVRSRL